LDDKGQLTVGPAQHGEREVHRQVGAAELAPIEQAIAELDPAKSAPLASPTPGCCDIGYRALAVDVAGRLFAVPPEGRLSTLVWALQRDTLRTSEDRYWRDAPPFNAGMAWTVTATECSPVHRSREGVRPGRWPKEDAPNKFSGSFGSRDSRQPVHDSVIIESVTRDRIVLLRASTHERYVGRWDPAQPDEFSFADNTPDACNFTVQIYH
jgi:hypothetical protein